MALTNRGKKRLLDIVFRGVAPPANFNLALCRSTNTPTPDTNVFSDLVEISAGNGYISGGQAVARNTTDFDVSTEDDANDRALVQLKDFVWTAAGGALPASGLGARWAVLLDDNVTVASREVWAYWDLVSDRQVSDTQTLTLQNAEIRGTE